MKLSNFKLTKVIGSGPLNWEFLGIVDESRWYRKNDIVRPVRIVYGENWHFMDTGEFTPGFQVEQLVRVWESKNGKIERFEIPPEMTR